MSKHNQCKTHAFCHACDAKAENPVTRPIEPTGVGVTMLDCLGIHSIARAELNVLPDGEFIHELF